MWRANLRCVPKCFRMRTRSKVVQQKISRLSLLPARMCFNSLRRPWVSVFFWHWQSDRIWTKSRVGLRGRAQAYSQSCHIEAKLLKKLNIAHLISSAIPTAAHLLAATITISYILLRSNKWALHTADQHTRGGIHSRVRPCVHCRKENRSTRSGCAFQVNPRT